MNATRTALNELLNTLTLPGATLRCTTLANTDLRLWLLDVDDNLELNAQAIGDFWQQLPYWAFAWAGGYALARYLIDHPTVVKGKRILDFGCGSGIAAIAAAHAGAQTVWVADLDATALKAAHANAALNHVVLHSVTDVWPKVDVLLAADVLYDISSSDDLGVLLRTIPFVCLAESRHIAEHRQILQPHRLRNVTTLSSHTLPNIGDFDEHVNVTIYQREQLC